MKQSELEIRVGRELMIIRKAEARLTALLTLLNNEPKELDGEQPDEANTDDSGK